MHDLQFLVISSLDLILAREAADLAYYHYNINLYQLILDMLQLFLTNASNLISLNTLRFVILSSFHLILCKIHLILRKLHLKAGLTPAQHPSTMRTSLLLLAALGVVSVITTPAVALDGKWQPIKNVTDPHVQDLGTWAVVKLGMVTNYRLRFKQVVSGEVQIVTEGMNYRLDVQVSRMDEKEAMYKAGVLETDTPFSTIRKLVSFARAN